LIERLPVDICCDLHCRAVDLVGQSAEGAGGAASGDWLACAGLGDHHEALRAAGPRGVGQVREFVGAEAGGARWHIDAVQLELPAARSRTAQSHAEPGNRLPGRRTRVEQAAHPKGVAGNSGEVARNECIIAEADYVNRVSACGRAG
jgi:hypothetical protein